MKKLCTDCIHSEIDKDEDVLCNHPEAFWLDSALERDNGNCGLKAVNFVAKREWQYEERQPEMWK